MFMYMCMFYFVLVAEAYYNALCYENGSMYIYIYISWFGIMFKVETAYERTPSIKNFIICNLPQE